jgi:ADP-ribose pyrophosphatase
MVERTVATERPWSGRLLRVRVDEVEQDDGRRTRREIVEHPGAVGILAWNGSRLGMVRQWRHAVGAELLEIPAGTLDPGEEPMATAQRELAEEMGIQATSWSPGPSFFTAPGFCTERLSLFLATGLAEADAASPEDEAIEREWLTLVEATDAIGRGTIADAKSIAGIFWLARHLGGGRGNGRS